MISLIYKTLICITWLGSVTICQYHIIFNTRQVGTLIKWKCDWYIFNR